MDPDRQIGQIAASDQEQPPTRNTAAYRKPSPQARGGEVADFNFFGHRL